MKKSKKNDDTEKPENGVGNDKSEKEEPADTSAQETRKSSADKSVRETETEPSSADESVFPDKVIRPDVPVEMEEDRKPSRYVDSISAFALILSVVVLIMILKIYPQLNINVEEDATSVGKIEQRMDNLFLEIARLQNQSETENIDTELDNLKGLLSTLDSLQGDSNDEIRGMASKIQMDISKLLSSLQKQDNQKAIQEKKAVSN